MGYLIKDRPTAAESSEDYNTQKLYARVVDCDRYNQLLSVYYN